MQFRDLSTAPNNKWHLSRPLSLYNGHMPEMIESSCGVRYSRSLLTNHEYRQIQPLTCCKICIKRAFRALALFLTAIYRADDWEFHNARRQYCRKRSIDIYALNRVGALS